MKIKEKTVFIFAIYLLIILTANWINSAVPGHASLILSVLLNLQLVAYAIALYLASRKQ